MHLDESVKHSRHSLALFSVLRTHTQWLLGPLCQDVSQVFLAKCRERNSLYHIAMMTVSPGPIVLSKAPRKNLVTSKVSALKHVAVNISTAPHSSLRWLSNCNESSR